VPLDQVSPHLPQTISPRRHGIVEARCPVPVHNLRAQRLTPNAEVPLVGT
jgi:hypothetical protein